MGLFFAANFYVLDIDDACLNNPTLLDRPLLKMSRKKIDVAGATLTMNFDGEVFKFNIFDVIRFHTNINYLFILDTKLS